MEKEFVAPIRWRCALLVMYLLLAALTAFPLSASAQDTNPFGAFGDAVKNLEIALGDKKEPSPKSEEKAAPVPSNKPDQAPQAQEAPTSEKNITLGQLTWSKRGEPGTIGALSVSQRRWVNLPSSNEPNMEGYTCRTVLSQSEKDSTKGKRLDWQRVKWSSKECSSPPEPGATDRIPRYQYTFTVMPNLSYQPKQRQPSFDKKRRPELEDPQLDGLQKGWDKYVAPSVPAGTIAVISHTTVLRGSPGTQISEEDILKRLDDKFANLGNRKLVPEVSGNRSDKTILVSYGGSTIEVIRDCSESASNRMECFSAASDLVGMLVRGYDETVGKQKFYGVEGSGGVGVAVFFDNRLGGWVIREMIVFEEPIKKANEQWKLMLKEAAAVSKEKELGKF